MTWPDAIFSVGSLVFIAGLPPTLLGKSRPPRSTSIATGSTLLVFAGSYATLGLWWSFASTLVLSVLWLSIAYRGPS